MNQLFNDTPKPRRPAIPLLVELCAGTAALSLRLERAGARPPVSRMGAKTGYADCILALAGLQPGDMAAHYLWSEPDDGVRLLLHAYRDADLAREAARIIRSWADEEPRALWERLRAEGPARCPPVNAQEIARWVNIQAWGSTGYWCGPDRGGGCGAHPEGWTGSITTAGLSKRMATQAGLPATIHDDASTVDPREVARCLQIIASNELINLDSRTWRNTGRGGSTFAQSIGYGADRMLRKLEAAPCLPATINGDATTAHIPDPLPKETVVFIDPPYVGTTGYAHDLDRAAVIGLAQRWAAAGARVMVSEAVPIDALVARGWHAVEISAMRVGQKRTFSKQQREWVTTSFEPERRAVRACELAAERAQRAAAVMAGGEQRDLFGVPELGNRSRGGGRQSATAFPPPSTGASSSGEA